ncbi:Crp/Fnr family transcriptional regulator [Acaryochloris sp. CCMEE 5410]|uniref:Crp/Fnr family transcriptional regulator n=1 Tax=Acaryochloris sp. CCMEE 5410 TaxID=310037 RepID=UPI00024848A7|nr:Crp/Fnr family transcriptional regulator [Acaryochloris sp. CCMEE 5410]KAI9134961.1 Crp/Fnr family transcriptional regulator [Acaryochloris sp. CCMEE 5410]
MYEVLFQRLNQLVFLNPRQQQELRDVLQVIKRPKDDCFLEVGQVSNHIYFVQAGILRSFYTFEGKEVTQWFCFPNHFAASYFSFAYRQPSKDCLSSLTEVTLLAISYNSLQQLIHQDKVWADLNRRLLEHYYTMSLQRIASFQVLSTAERYEQLLYEHPTIESEVPLGYLASYLGMTQETLSRIRRRKKKRK